MKNSHTTRVAVAAVALCFLSACGGHSAFATPPVAASAAAQQGAVTVELRIPKPETHASVVTHTRVSPRYISAATKSVEIDVYGGSPGAQTSYYFNTTPSSPNCTPSASGTSCRESINAPLGNDALTFTAYDAPLTPAGAVTGSQLSRGQAYATIVEGQANVVRITLFGTPASVKLSPSLVTPPQGSTTTTPLSFTAYDADGYAIAGQFSIPVGFPCTNATLYSLSVAITDNGQSVPWIVASSDTVTLTYTGSGIESMALNACLVGSTNVIGSTVVTPTGSFSAETAVDTSLDNATAYSDYDGEWFTEPGKSRLAALATGAQQPVYYPVPSGARPLRTLPRNGSDIIFTLSDNAIGLLTQGAGGTGVSEFPLPTASAGLYGLGGWWSYDFSIWFTEHDAGKVGELETIATTYGHVLEYPTGFAGSTPAGMALGPAGFVFADPGTNSIGVCNPGTGGTPTIVEYPLPTANAMPLEITGADNNGRVWFTEKRSSKIGRMDASGAINEYPSVAVPVALVLQNNVVFVLTSSNTIERYDINTGASTVITPPTSTNGPVVAIGDGGFYTLELLRVNGTTGALQQYRF